MPHTEPPISRASDSGRRFPGLFVVVEGIDGCGSTTHAKLLAKAIKNRGPEVVLTCEPSTGPIGSLIRQVLQRRLFVADATGPRNFAWSTMALLFAADRRDHLRREIEPRLADGVDIVTDRYVMSSLAYQAEEADRDWVAGLQRGVRPTDVTILLDVPVSVAKERRRAAGRVVERYDDDVIQARVADNYTFEDRSAVARTYAWEHDFGHCRKVRDVRVFQHGQGTLPAGIFGTPYKHAIDKVSARKTAFESFLLEHYGEPAK